MGSSIKMDCIIKETITKAINGMVKVYLHGLRAINMKECLKMEKLMVLEPFFCKI